MTDQTSEQHVAPPRLRMGETPIAELLKVGASPEPLDLNSGYRALKERRDGQLRRRRWASSIALVAGAVFAWSAWHAEGPVPQMSAKAEHVLDGFALVPEAHESEALDGEPVTKSPTVAESAGGEELLDHSTTSSERPDRVSPRSEKTWHQAPEVPNPEAKQPLVENCGRLTAKDHRAALDCYARVSRGEGISAELAYLEQARIQRRALGDPPLALRTLEQYHERFAAGVLAEEALLARTDLLVSLGKEQEAASVLDRELARKNSRSTKVLVWRAQLAGRLGDCSLAAKLVDELKSDGNIVEALLPILESCH